MMLTETQYTDLLGCPLFKNITLPDLAKLLSCLDFSLKHYEAESLIFTQGVVIHHIYIVLDGTVELTKENFAGQKNIISLLSKPQIFGEGIVCTKERISPVTVTALTPVTLLLIPYERILRNCSHKCSFHHQLTHNMMLLLGEKNYHLTTKMDLLLLKGMREKLATYLLLELRKNQSPSFTISLNRTQLSDYLNVSRSSMCRELSRMKEEGLIDYYQNSFKILNEKRLREVLS